MLFMSAASLGGRISGRHLNERYILASLAIAFLTLVRQSHQARYCANQTTASDLSARHLAAADSDWDPDSVDPSSQSGGGARDAPAGGVSGLFGQVAKTVIYGGAALAQLNSPLLCALLKHETDKDNEDQPILFAFNNNLNKEQAFRIYSDDEITESIIEEAQFDPHQMTLIFVHGWLGGIHKELWLSEAKNAALESSFMYRRDGWPWSGAAAAAGSRVRDSSTPAFRPNVIVVDWSEFASGTLYTATQNSLKVSRRLARLLGQLADVGALRPNLMHCLGHSIGTHICGQAARQAFPSAIVSPPRIVQAERRFGRITGLDPGGFCYELDIKNETSYLGLRPSDALLVDAYYSNRSPFGNRYQVAQYNVRVNNGFFQGPCSVWKRPEVAREYFRAAMRWAFGGTASVAGNEVLTCDHYFGTRFAHQLLPNTCSYVGYNCDSYRNYLRGKCGLCESPAQCFSMDFEYQVPNPSIEHALRHIRKHSSLYSGGSPRPDAALVGGVPYEDRRTYFMRIADEEPYCSPTFRVRVALDTGVVKLRSFRSDWLKLRFFSSATRMMDDTGGNGNSSLKVRDAGRNGRKVELLSLHGPWFAAASDEKVAAQVGLDERTLTALFELDSPATHRMQRSSEPPIEHIQVEYNNEPNRGLAPPANPIEYIQLDYLSSTEPRTRSRFSRSFQKGQFSVVYKRLGGNVMAAPSH